MIFKVVSKSFNNKGLGVGVTRGKIHSPDGSCLDFNSDQGKGWRGKRYG